MHDPKQDGTKDGEKSTHQQQWAFVTICSTARAREGNRVARAQELNSLGKASQGELWSLGDKKRCQKLSTKAGKVQDKKKKKQQIFFHLYSNRLLMHSTGQTQRNRNIQKQTNSKENEKAGRSRKRNFQQVLLVKN